MTFSLVVAFCILHCHVQANQYDGWIKETSRRLTKADEQIAVGYSGSSIYLIGGYMDTIAASREEYNILSNTVTNMSKISPQMYGFAQYYTQHNNILYMVFNTNLYSCDLTNQCDMFQTQTIEGGVNVGFSGCVASHQNLIFVLGGSMGLTYYGHLSILNSTSDTWIVGPYMYYKRAFFSCVANPTTDKLYAIGGKNDSTTTTATIEAIDISNIVNENWSIVSSLLYPSTSTRAVTHSHNILVIGGTPAMDEIQLLNCLTNEMTSGGFLNYGIRQTAVIIVQDILYAFGGNNGTSVVDTWQYLDLSSSNSDYPTTSVPTTLYPTTVYPTTTIPSTANPTTIYPTTSTPTTLTPTTLNPTTIYPTNMTITPTYQSTTVPPTNNSTSIMPTSQIPTTIVPTETSITSEMPEIYGVSIQIQFDYRMDVIIIINVTDTIQKTINVIVTESIETDCLLSDNDYEIKTSINEQTNVTTVEVRVIVCDETSETNLRVVFENNLKSDLITNINENTKLSIPNELIGVVVSDIVPRATAISTTSEHFNDKELPKQKNNNSIIYIFAVIGSVLACIVVIICTVCIYKFKTLDAAIKTQELQTYVNSSNTEPGQTDIVSPSTMVKVNSVSVETDIITAETVTKGYGTSDINQVTILGPNEFVVDGDSENENQEGEGIDIKYSTRTNKPKKHVYPTPLGITGTVGNDNQVKTEKGLILIAEWLKNTVQLPQYKDNFVDNGYATLQMIVEIREVNELIEIGIVSKNDRLVLLKEIETLKHLQQSLK